MSRDECVCLVEDVVTSRRRALEAVEALREAGLRVSTAVCVVDREEGGADGLARARRPAPPALPRVRAPGERPRKSRMVERYPTALLGSRPKLSTPPPVRRKALTKQEFIQKVAQKSGLSTRDAGKAVDAFMEAVTDTLKSRDSINFTGFGKFSAAIAPPGRASTPATGERVQIAATTVPKFSAGSQLKAAVKGG